MLSQISLNSPVDNCIYYLYTKNYSYWRTIVEEIGPRSLKKAIFCKTQIKVICIHLFIYGDNCYQYLWKMRALWSLLWCQQYDKRCEPESSHFRKLSADLGVGPPLGDVRECGAIVMATFDYLFLTSGQYIDNRLSYYWLSLSIR